MTAIFLNELKTVTNRFPSKQQAVNFKVHKMTPVVRNVYAGSEYWSICPVNKESGRQNDGGEGAHKRRRMATRGDGSGTFISFNCDPFKT